MARTALREGGEHPRVVVGRPNKIRREYLTQAGVLCFGHILGAPREPGN